MFVWIALLAYFLFSLNGIVDKFLLSRAVKHPVAYAFYLGVTGPLTWFLAPFGLKLLSLENFFIALVGGACFIIAAYFFYNAVQQTSISRILPIQGGLVPVFTLILAYGLLGERLATEHLAAFVFLVLGSVLIAFEKDKRGWTARALGNGIIAAMLFALSLTLTKYIFQETNFVSGLIWTRLGFLAVSLSLLIPRESRKYIFDTPKETSKGNLVVYLGSRVSGGLGGLLQNYAIAVGSVTIVNAMQGTQYALLLLMTLMLSKYYPKVLKEKISGLILVQKIFALVLIALGLALLRN